MDPRAVLNGLGELFSYEPEQYLRRLPGREVFLWSDPDLGPVVVKRARERWTPLRSSAGEREHENLERLAEDGLPVPRALACSCVRMAPFVRRSLVVMEKVEHAETLRERLLSCPTDERAHWRDALVELVVRLHERGWYHRDLYLQHLVIRRDELVLLDVGRARRADAPRRRWFVKDLAALASSAPRTIGPRDKLRFLAAYFDARGVRSRAERRRWKSEVVAKAARIARHRPKQGEDRPWEDQ